MKKKIVMFGLSICLVAASCSGKGTGKESREEARDAGQEEPSRENEKETEKKEEASQKDEMETSKKDGKNASQKEPSNKDKKDPQKKEEKAPSQEEQAAGEEEPAETLGQGLSQTPEVTFIDYSRDIKDEESGATLLSVAENCPVISIPENEAAAEKMNMVFEQQHTANQTYIEEDTETARDAYQALSQEEAGTWGGYGYGVSYKVVYASPKILSIEAENYKWQGNPHPNTWTSSYCFDAATGTLLYLSDVFTDKTEAGKIVEKAILDTITKEPYKDALMPDYESYVPDLLTENVFYLNEKGLVVICNPDMVTVYAAGVIEVEVPYEELKSVMNPNFISG